LTRAGRFAVIGAGMAGLACARTLQDAGAAVTVFERESFPGGRAATLIDAAGPFDHGAQYFTANDPRFIAVLEGWQSAGVVQRWTGRIVAFEAGTIQDKTASAERFVGVPGMRRLGVYLAQSLDVRYSMTIARLRHGPSGWHLDGDDQPAEGFGPFDAVVLAMPSEPAADLLHGLTALADEARTVNWDPCWVVTMALAQKSGANFEGAFINDDPILGWVALDSAKPRRGQVDGVAERWVLHARAQWSKRYADMAEQEVARWMTRSFSALLRGKPMSSQARALFWRYAKPVNPLQPPFLWDDVHRLGMAGDWCGGARIEGAYLSGLAMAQALLQ
jgi:predicted NAD/FAD-dependent oxidoreductase